MMLCAYLCLFTDEIFNHTHIAVMSAIFRELGCDWNTMMLPPEQLPNVFSALAIPIGSRRELEHALLHTQCRNTPGNKIGFLKCCKYVLRHARDLCMRYPLQRMRIMADLTLNPPIEEARIIILDLAAHERRHEMRKKYRHTYIAEATLALAEEAQTKTQLQTTTTTTNSPTHTHISDVTASKVGFHLCHFCGLRFANERGLQRHKVQIPSSFQWIFVS